MKPSESDPPPSSKSSSSSSKSSSCASKFLWMRQAAWWPCWWGAFFFLLILSINLGAGYRNDLLPGTWDDSPLEAWPTLVVASVISLVFAGLIIIPGLEDMAIQKGKKWTRLRGKPLRLNLFGALVLSMAIALISYIIGSQTQIKGVGLGAEFWAILIGIIIINGCSHFMEKVPEFLTLAAAMGEDIIKLGLILLGIDLQTLAGLGLPGIVVGIPVTIVVLSVAYAVGSRMVKAPQRRLCMILCGGLSVCGASAATAVQSVIGGTSQELTLSISIVTIMTIIQMIALPYIAIAAKISKTVIAAALGGCVNSTGSVVAAAGFLGDQEYVNIAAAVKIIQNAFLGFVAVGVAVYWAAVEEKHGSAWSKELKKEEMRNRARSSIAMTRTSIATAAIAEEPSEPSVSNSDSLHSLSDSDPDSGDDIKLDIRDKAKSDSIPPPPSNAPAPLSVADEPSNRRRSSSTESAGRRRSILGRTAGDGSGRRRSFMERVATLRSDPSENVPISSSAPNDYNLSSMGQIVMSSSAPMKSVLGGSAEVNFSSSSSEHRDSSTTDGDDSSTSSDNKGPAYGRSKSSNFFTNAISKISNKHTRNVSSPVVMDVTSAGDSRKTARRESTYMPIKAGGNGSLSDDTDITVESQFAYPADYPEDYVPERRPSATDFVKGKTEVRWYQMFWRKFPKFVIGFLTLSICLTIIRAVDPGTYTVEEESVFNTTKSQMQDASRWFFTLGFVGIGLSSEFKSLYANLMGGADLSKMNFMQKMQQASRFIGVYCFGQLFNIVLTFAVAYAMFKDFEVEGL